MPNGISDNLLNEVRKVLAVSRLVKVTFSQDRETRSNLLCELEERLNAIAIAKVGKSLQFTKKPLEFCPLGRSELSSEEIGI